MSDIDISLTERWSQIERVRESNGGNDTIVGNTFNNYFDPGEENCYLQGNNGSDTYIINSSYGKVIYNSAKDDAPDTLRLHVPYFSINASIQGGNIELTLNTMKGCVNVKLEDYFIAHHLTVLTDDGTAFVIPPTINHSQY